MNLNAVKVVNDGVVSASSWILNRFVERTQRTHCVVNGSDGRRKEWKRQRVVVVKTGTRNKGAEDQQIFNVGNVVSK